MQEICKNCGKPVVKYGSIRGGYLEGDGKWQHLAVGYPVCSKPEPKSEAV